MKQQTKNLIAAINAYKEIAADDLCNCGYILPSAVGATALNLHTEHCPYRQEMLKAFESDKGTQHGNKTEK